MFYSVLLAFFPWTGLVPLGSLLNNSGDLLTKGMTNILDGPRGVFNDIVQDAGNDGAFGTAVAYQNRGDPDRMDYVWDFGAFSKLTPVCFYRELDRLKQNPTVPVMWNRGFPPPAVTTVSLQPLPLPTIPPKAILCEILTRLSTVSGILYQERGGDVNECLSGAKSSTLINPAMPEIKDGD